MKPGKRGSTFDDLPKGPVPKEGGANTVRGSEVPTKPGELGHATALVLRWLNTDEKQRRRWRDEADTVHQIAAQSQEVLNGSATLREMKVRELKIRLQNEFTAKSPAKVSNVYQDLMMNAIQEVNWEEIAGELIGK